MPSIYPESFGTQLTTVRGMAITVDDWTKLTLLSICIVILIALPFMIPRSFQLSRW
jgi:hypothetical protein